MINIHTISEFLLQAGTDYRIFDMGRGIRKLSNQVFLDLESAITAAPCPRQQHAWFGVIFFNKQLNSEHFIWFVKLPLDEQGLLMAAARDHFLQIIVDALGQQLENQTKTNGQLPENPYSFLPTQQQLADFNSTSRLDFNIGQSQHYAAALAYFEHPEQQSWQLLSLQGIADFAALVKQKKTRDLLIASLPQLAPQVYAPLCASLENHPIPLDLSQCINDWVMDDLKDVTRVQSGLRALSQSTAKTMVQALILNVLKSKHSLNGDVLILLAARHWQHMCDELVLESYINNLAQLDDDMFIGLYSDLVQIPILREKMLGVLRWPQKSKALSGAIGKLFSGQAK
jgi:hypothetical protein